MGGSDLAAGSLRISVILVEVWRWNCPWWCTGVGVGDWRETKGKH